jgi:hypothetical protein
VNKYVNEWNVDRVVDVIVDIKRLLYGENIRYCPSMRLLIVRVCSAIGIEPDRRLRDIYPSNVKAKHEFLFYGVIVPSIALDVSNCIYFREWFKDLRGRARTLGDTCIGHEWKDWDDRWTDFWRRENSGLNDRFVKCGRGR